MHVDHCAMYTHAWHSISDLFINLLLPSVHVHYVESITLYYWITESALENDGFYLASGGV